MTSTGGTTFENHESDRYGVLAPDYPLPKKRPVISRPTTPVKAVVNRALIHRKPRTVAGVMVN